MITSARRYKYPCSVIVVKILCLLTLGLIASFFRGYFILPVAAATLRPWGAMYSPYQAMDDYRMTGVTTGQLNSDTAVLSELQQARAHNVSVILTIGNVDECRHVSNNVYQYNTAINYFDAILTSTVRSQLQSYVDDGTLRALRFYDEAQNCKCCNTSYSMRRCNASGNGIETRTDITSLPIGTDSQPGFADMLHHIQFSNGGLPESLPIGGTHGFSYMLYVRDRMNTLRVREGRSLLSPKKILGIVGYQDSSDILSFISCIDYYFSDDFQNIYLFIYPSCEYNSDNHLFFTRYIALCNSNTFDFINSWGWELGAAGTFQSRIQALERGDVPGVTLENLQDACFSPSVTIPPTSPTPTFPSNQPGDVDGDGDVDIFDLVIVGNSFGKSPGEAGYDSRADANGSGGAIDIFDLIMVGSNFGT